VPTAPPKPNYLDPADLAALARLVPGVARGAAGHAGGFHAATQPGRAVEFLDHRPYVPGDPPTDVDWKAWGRTDRLLIRRHERATDQAVHLLVDASASMGFTGFPRPRKGREGQGRRRKRVAESLSTFDHAARLAVGLAFVHLRQHDRVGLRLAGEVTPKTLPPARHPAQLGRVADRLSEVTPQGPARLAEAVHAGLALRDHRGRLVIVSDLHEPAEALWAAVAAARGRGDAVSVYHVQHHAAQHLPDFDEAVLVDPETGRRRRTNLAALRPGFTEIVQAERRRWRNELTARGVAYHVLDTAEPVVAALRRTLTGQAYGSMATHA
jgi:uncharacterized protein (DUF58 family)